MKYQVLKLSFTGAVHLGMGILETGAAGFCADTLFSALCTEAFKRDGESGITALYDAAKNGKLVISDAFPYCGETLYIPKPAVPVRSSQVSEDADSTVRKQFKKLRYLPVSAVETYLSGMLSPEECKKYTDETDRISEFSLQTKVRIYDNREKDPEPYYVGCCRFRENCGLWVLLGTDESVTESVTALFHALGTTGIGGKLSSGYGRFTVDMTAPADALLSMLNASQAGTFMTLSICLPLESELAETLGSASYSVMRRGGFIASECYAEKAQKKNDLYMLSAGSCFAERFHGDIYDVSGGHSHPVYHYGIPLLVRVR